jgi:hypothetical protein
MPFGRFGTLAGGSCPAMLCITLCAGSLVRAQVPATQPINRQMLQMYRGDPEVLLQRLQDQLDSLKLTDAQDEQVQAVIAKAEQSIKLLDQELQNATPAQRGAHVSGIFQDIRASLQSILSDEQRQQLRAMAGADGANRFQRLRDALAKIQMSDSQKQQIEALLADARARLEAARPGAAGRPAGGPSTTQPNAQPGGGQIQERLRQILSDEQLLQLRDLMTAGPGPATKPASTPNLK